MKRVICPNLTEEGVDDIVGHESSQWRLRVSRKCFNGVGKCRQWFVCCGKNNMSKNEIIQAWKDKRIESSIKDHLIVFKCWGAIAEQKVWVDCCIEDRRIILAVNLDNIISTEGVEMRWGKKEGSNCVIGVVKRWGVGWWQYRSLRNQLNLKVGRICNHLSTYFKDDLKQEQNYSAGDHIRNLELSK